MKKTVLTIYYHESAKEFIKHVIRWICRISGVKMIEILETEIPEIDN